MPKKDYGDIEGIGVLAKFIGVSATLVAIYFALFMSNGIVFFHFL